MNKTNLRNLLILLVICFGFSCKVKKNVVNATKPTVETVSETDKASEVLKVLQDKDIPFNTIAMKADVDLDINGKRNNVNMNIRMEKGKQIWVSVTAIAGIEVARALITRDSIKVRNNLQRVYLRKPFNYVKALVGDEIDFQTVQNLLVGNSISQFMSAKPSVKLDSGVWHLQGQTASLSFTTLFNNLLKISKHQVQGVNAGYTLNVSYKGYQEMNKSLFPSVVEIASKRGSKSLAIHVSYSKLNINVPLEFPFNVPDKFEVIN